MADLNGLAADCQRLRHYRVGELGSACALCEQGDTCALGVVHDPLCFFVALELGRIHNDISAALLSQLNTLRNRLEADQLCCACGLHQGDCCQTDRACAEYCYMAARTDAAAANEQTVVCNAGRLYHCAQLHCCLLVAKLLSDVVYRIAVLCMYSSVLSEAAVIGQTRLLEFLTLVEHTTAACITLTAPVHGLYADKVADLELLNILANLYDLTCKLMAGDDRELGVTGVHGVALVIRSHQMLVSAADTCCANLNQNLIVSALRHRTIGNTAVDILPDRAAAEGTTSFFLALGQYVIRLRSVLSFNIISSHNVILLLIPKYSLRDNPSNPFSASQPLIILY